MKKRTSVIVMGLSVCMLLVGCGGNKHTSDVRDNVKLTYYYPATVTQDSIGIDEVYVKANEIIKEKIGAEVDFKATSMGEYQQKIALVLATREECDVFWTSSWLNSFTDNVHRDALLDITDLLPKYAPETYAGIKEDYWKAAMVDNRIYAVLNKQIFARQSVFFVDKAFVEENNIDISNVNSTVSMMPVYDQIVATGINPQEKSVVCTPSGIEWTNSVMQEKGWQTPVNTNVPGAVDENCNVFNQFKTSEFKEYVEFCRALYNKGYINNRVIDGQITNDNYITASAGTYKPGAGDAEGAAFMRKPIIQIPYGKALLSTESLTATMTGISSFSKNPEKSMQFIELLNSDKDLFNVLSHGIEGRDYEKIGENKIKKLDGALYSESFNWVFGNVFNGYLTPEMPDDCWEKEEAFNDGGEVSPILGFTFDPSNVTTEISNCNAVAGEYMLAFALGSMDVDVKLPEFLNKLDTAGAEVIISELQSQLDEFMSK